LTNDSDVIPKNSFSAAQQLDATIRVKKKMIYYHFLKQRPSLLARLFIDIHTFIAFVLA